MIVDTFLYAGETDMLELRLRTLRDVVDVSVAVTCSLTHQGERAYTGAPVGGVFDDVNVWWYEVQAERLPPAARGGVGTAEYQRIERQHRDGIVAACDAAGVSADAIVLVSDVDEIPDPTAVRIVADQLTTGVHGSRPHVLQQRFHSCALDLLHPQQPWLGTCIGLRRDLAPQGWRDARGDRAQMSETGPGGWHFSWFGKDADRQRKLDTFSHAELRGHLDVTTMVERRTHSNGEQLHALTPFEMRALDWPAPMVDESFRVPAHWMRWPWVDIPGVLK